MKNQTEHTHDQDGALFCYRHPDQETYLRCNQCDRPICTSCAISTPTGYRCPECIRGQQKKFDTAQFGDYILAVVVSAGIAFLGSYVAGFLGFFTLLIAPIASTLISEVLLHLTRGRNSGRLNQVILISAILGSLPLLLQDGLIIFTYLLNGVFPNIYSFLPTVWQLGYTIILATTLRARTKGLYLG